MRAVVQRVTKAKVKIDDETVGEIKQGFVVLLGVHQEDTKEDADYLAKKIARLRIFEDENGPINAELATVQGEILSISQFTLYAQTTKGNRPSFNEAAKADLAKPLYEAFNEELRSKGIRVATGIFGADMEVSLVNDGPVTIIYDTREGSVTKNKNKK